MTKRILTALALLLVARPGSGAETSGALANPVIPKIEATPNPASAVDPGESKDTIITSDRLEMRNDGEEAYFAFSNNVRLVGTNLEVTCDLLEVFAESKGGEDGAIGSVGGIQRIIASGEVVISQEGRQATAGRAEVMPLEDKIVLTEDPVVVDPQGTIAGERMIFYRGDQNAEIEKPKVLLRALPDLGFKQEKPSPKIEGGTAPAAGAVAQPAPLHP